MNSGNVDLCQEILSAMSSLQFSNDSITKLNNNLQFIEAQGKFHVLQRTILTMMFYQILTGSGYFIPREIRLSLNIATDALGWLDDIKLVILPFMKENEDKFFPVNTH